MENSNKFAVFLAKIPNIIYSIAFVLGWGIEIAIKIKTAGGLSVIFSDGWSIFIFIVDLIIIGSLIATAIIIISGLFICIIHKFKK